MSDLAVRLKELKPAQERVSGISVSVSAPMEVASSTVSGGKLVIDADTLKTLGDAVFRVGGRDYTDYIYNICTSTPSFLSMCRGLAEAVRKCDKGLIPKLLPTQLEELSKYVSQYIDGYCRK
jgi:hypothetical protein